MIDIATGEGEQVERTANEARAAKAGAVGGPARAKALTPSERSEIASVAAQARWKRKANWLSGHASISRTPSALRNLP
jgi:hypothetical protein